MKECDFKTRLFVIKMCKRVLQVVTGFIQVIVTFVPDLWSNN